MANWFYYNVWICLAVAEVFYAEIRHRHSSLFVGVKTFSSSAMLSIEATHEAIQAHSASAAIQAHSALAAIQAHSASAAIQQ